MSGEEQARRARIGDIPGGAISALSLLVIATEGLALGLRRTMIGERLSSSGALGLDEIAAVIQLVAAVSVILVFSKATHRDFGLTRKGLVEAIAIAAAIWALSQLTQMVIGLGRSGYLAIYEGWESPLAMLSPLLGALAVESFPEELVWRGIILIWLLDYMERKVSLNDPFFRLGSALLPAGLLYAVSEFPDRALESAGQTLVSADLLALTAVGIFFSLLYLRTNNLLLVVLLHMFVLYPLPLADPFVDASRLIVITSVILLIPRPGDSLTRNRSPRASRSSALTR